MRSSVNGMTRVPVRSLGGDVLLALAIAVAAFTAAASSQESRGLIFTLAAIGTTSLAVRRLFPITVLALSSVITAFIALHFDNAWWPFAALIALYTVAAHCPRNAAAWAGGAALAVLSVPVFHSVNWGHLAWHNVAFIGGRLAPLVAAWLLGDNVRTRREYLVTLVHRAEQLEREQDANARRAAAEEQARIARDVHDVVAHNLSVIVVQATAAEAVFDSDPSEARRAVRTIGSTGRQALDELRRVLGVVRDNDALAPQPTLTTLDELIGHVRAAGLDVDLAVTGERRELPPALELSAYRIIQEALTNTLRHASARRAVVNLRFDTDALVLEVIDDGTLGEKAGSGSSGRGLIGMHERAAAFGGELHAGLEPNGGFRVAARLPLGLAGS